jgi:hypothetical protein
LVISNFESWTELHPKAEYEKRMPDTIQRAEEHDGPVLMFMDKLSSEGNHTDIQKSGVEEGLRSYFRKMGKEPYQASYIGVGHSLIEVAPMLRSGEVAYFGFKEGKTKEAARKHLVVYEDEDKENKVIDLKGIGLPEYSPDTNDPAEWDWGTPEEFVELGHMKPEDVDGDVDEGESKDTVDTDKFKLREREDMCLRMNQAMSHSEISEATGIAKSTVGDMIRRAKSRQDSTE